MSLHNTSDKSKSTVNGVGKSRSIASHAFNVDDGEKGEDEDDDDEDEDAGYDEEEARSKRLRFRWFRCFWSPILPEGIPYKVWKGLMDLAHILNLILVPALLGWTTIVSDASYVYILITFALDCILLADCIIQSRLVFKDEFGVVCSNPAQLRRNFFIDNWGILPAVMSLPIDLLVFWNKKIYFTFSFDTAATTVDPLMYHNLKIWAFVNFLKMVLRTPYQRIYNISIPRLAIPISRLVKTMLILMLMGHIDACLFWFIDQLLDPPDRWMDVNHLASTPDETVKMSTQYLVSYISALKSLVLKLRDVRLDAENIYVIFEFVCGILAYGTVFGNIHSIVEMLDNTAVSTQAGE
ncbi:Cyclic nucleotide-gated olfactory channel [Irineochytrium annulatum]|nr:Cyclic nucleotide-gated olfactory channel [Irineochytrium annulatum]